MYSCFHSTLRGHWALFKCCSNINFGLGSEIIQHGLQTTNSFTKRVSGGNVNLELGDTWTHWNRCPAAGIRNLAAHGKFRSTNTKPMMPRGQNKLGSYLEINWEVRRKVQRRKPTTIQPPLQRGGFNTLQPRPGSPNVYCTEDRCNREESARMILLPLGLDEAIWLEIFKFDYDIILRGNWLCLLCSNHYKRPSFRAIFNTPE